MNFRGTLRVKWRASSSPAAFQVARIVEHICRNEPEGAILVFLTGWDEISKTLDALKQMPTAGQPSKTLLLPLHGSMPTVNQREIFNRPPPGVRYGL